ncbi:hypothetical protein QBC46DRAFT_351764 [Diplogelasinospora grovesii]|uniref:2-dehydropantoate 2-reductase n=1 Tax=Diplogelasinospora grovesii TaxID=303347 RepID=A0AAN6NDP9_9PEZI|nr:hypothetical protein QBC46DRAFT_351764 [Diplogelasinospora grovesii]
MDPAGESTTPFRIAYSSSAVGRLPQLFNIRCHEIPPLTLKSGTLYLLTSSRPQPRVFAQILRRQREWFRNDTSAGRGATRSLSDRTSPPARSLAEHESQEHDAFQKVLKHQHVWTSPRDQRPLTIKPTAVGSAIPPPGKHENEQSAQVATRTTESSAASQSWTLRQDAERQPLRVGLEDETREPAQRQESSEKTVLRLWNREEEQPKIPGLGPLRVDVKAPYVPSDQVHVMGTDLWGRYMAHTLAGSKSIPPVRYIIHKPHLWDRWEEGGRRLILHRGDEVVVRDRVVGEFTSWTGAAPTYGPVQQGIIENLVVTVPAASTVRAFRSIKHRLDHRSTVCLVQDGLGIAEALINEYFPDESARPVFLLGHLSTALGYAEQEQFTMSELRQGRLYLSVWTPESSRGSVDTPFAIRRHPPPERVVRSTHFLRLLTSIPGLEAGGYPVAELFRHKLPALAFRAVADPVATLLDCTYDKILNNVYARQLVDKLLGEVCQVVARLPECRSYYSQSKFQGSGVAIASSLRHQILHRMIRQKDASSKMRVNTNRGWHSDVDFTTGYFVRRGREVNVRVDALETVMWGVKAKHLACLAARRNEIPLEGVGEPA